MHLIFDRRRVAATHVAQRTFRCAHLSSTNVTYEIFAINHHRVVYCSTIISVLFIISWFDMPVFCSFRAHMRLFDIRSIEGNGMCGSLGPVAEGQLESKYNTGWCGYLGKKFRGWSGVGVEILTNFTVVMQNTKSLSGLASSPRCSKQPSLTLCRRV
jgi:hypothetical protein